MSEILFAQKEIVQVVMHFLTRKLGRIAMQHFNKKVPCSLEAQVVEQRCI